MFIEEIKCRQRKKTYRTVLVRESYRQGKRVLHRTIANVSKLPDGAIRALKRFLEKKGRMDAEDSPFEISNGREYGASRAFLEVARDLGLPQMLHARAEPWVSDAMAMIAGRIVYQGSKLALTNLYASTSLWEQCGHPRGKRPDVDKHCYEVMDRLLSRQKAVQKQLARQRLKNNCLIYYDMTSSYMEGEYADSELVCFGYNRDRKRGHEQVAIGLLTDAEGCPVSVEVFAGNTTDQTTVKAKIDELKETYGLEQIVFAGDRGMLTPQRIQEANAAGFKTLTALTHPQIRDLLERKVIQLELFDEKKPVEVCDPEQNHIRYVLCLNPQSRKREHATRDALLEKTRTQLQKIATGKKKRTDEEIGAKVGVVLERYHTGKFIDWQVQKGRLTFQGLDDRVQDEAALDGCYLIRTDAGSHLLDTQAAVERYRSLAKIEQAFRYLKTVTLEMRPFYHHLDDRIRAHVFLCMLAYYVQWHALRRLEPLLESDGQGSERRWSLPVIIELLKAIQIMDVNFKGQTIQAVVARPTAEQQRILDLLKVSM
jgi:transposase